jgi:inorganic triphosphatase YgiF
MNLEQELKFRVAKRRLGALSRLRIAGARLGRGANQKLVSTYFDTPKQKLHGHGFTLRVRKADDEYVQTVKNATAGGFARGEWETKVQRAEPDFHSVGDTPLAPLATKKTRRKLKPVFQTSVRRAVRPLRVGPSEVELAVDRGKLSARRRSEPISEFELELKKGRVADLFRIARIFEQRTDAELDLRSKAGRGYQLANGDKHLSVHAEPLELAKKMTAHEAFNLIAHSALRHFSFNADGVRDLDGEAVHQMRVGLRRLRAAISLFAGILPRSRTGKIKSELKWLTNVLAPAREMDVFMKEQIKPLDRAAALRRGFHAIETQFASRRKTAFQKARDAIETPRYRRLLIDVLDWLETGKPQDAKQADAPINAFAGKLMKRRVHAAQKKGRHLSDLSARERHKLRIKIKKIRYAVDFFGSLYPDKAHEELGRLSGRLKKIQDTLGALNDFVAHRELAAEAALHARPEHRRARAFMSGVLVGKELEASVTLMKAASKQFRRLRPLSVDPS